MSKIEKLESYLKEHDFTFYNHNTEAGTFLVRPQMVKDKPMQLIITINSNETAVDLEIFDAAQVQPGEALYQLLNKLNSTYRYVKFVEGEGKITAVYSFDLQGEFNDDQCNYIMETMVNLLRTVEEVMPEFEKL